MRSERDKFKIEAISKDIQKEIRRHMRTSKREQISKILDDCKGLKKIADIRNNGKKALITSIRDQKGELQESLSDIANAFAEFYALLYDGSRNAAEEEVPRRTCEDIQPIECNDPHPVETNEK